MGNRGGRKKEIIYLSLYCHNQNDSRIKMDSDERLSLCFINCEGQSRKTMSTNYNLFEETGEPKRNRAETLLLTSLTDGPNRLTRNHISK